MVINLSIKVKYNLDCANGYALYQANTIISSASPGKYGGQFQYLSSCAELCTEDYGLLPCIGFAYEPDHQGFLYVFLPTDISGNCTIYQYSYQMEHFNTDPTTSSAVYTRCNFDPGAPVTLPSGGSITITNPQSGVVTPVATITPNNNNNSATTTSNFWPTILVYFHISRIKSYLQTTSQTPTISTRVTVLLFPIKLF